jgi:nitrate/nitrite transporter NarK
MAIEAGEGEASPPSGADLVKFLLGTGSWFGAFGLHGVLFSSLLVVYLEESEVRVGVAQSAVMLPAVFLILVGGAVADRVDRRRLLIWMHCMGALVTLGLAFKV